MRRTSHTGSGTDHGDVVQVVELVTVMLPVSHMIVGEVALTLVLIETYITLMM